MCNNNTVDLGLDSKTDVGIYDDRDVHTNLDVGMRGTDVDVCYWLWLDHELSFYYVVDC